MYFVCPALGKHQQANLFTNDDETILNLKRCVALNGTSVVVTRPDLLDRTIIIDLKRIPKMSVRTKHRFGRLST